MAGKKKGGLGHPSFSWLAGLCARLGRHHMALAITVSVLIHGVAFETYAKMNRYAWSRLPYGGATALAVNLAKESGFVQHGYIGEQGASPSPEAIKQAAPGDVQEAGQNGAGRHRQEVDASVPDVATRRDDDVDEEKIAQSTLAAEVPITKPKLLSDAGLPPPTLIPDVYPLPVVVTVFVGLEGEVEHVELGENFLSDVARQYIVEAISKLKFSPGMRGELPVRAQIQFVVKLDSPLPVQ